LVHILFRRQQVALLQTRLNRGQLRAVIGAGVGRL
jgi:hypothetical protein